MEPQQREPPSPPHPPNNTFGEFIRSVRMERGYSITYLAKRVGIAPRYLQDVERGRRRPFRGELLWYMAEALEVPIVFLAIMAGLKATGLSPDDKSIGAAEALVSSAEGMADFIAEVDEEKLAEVDAKLFSKFRAFTSQSRILLNALKRMQRRQ